MHFALDHLAHHGPDLEIALLPEAMEHLRLHHAVLVGISGGHLPLASGVRGSVWGLIVDSICVDEGEEVVGTGLEHKAELLTV